jgi:hypothetical protein
MARRRVRRDESAGAARTLIHRMTAAFGAELCVILRRSRMAWNTTRMQVVRLVAGVVALVGLGLNGWLLAQLWRWSRLPRRQSAPKGLVVLYASGGLGTAGAGVVAVWLPGSAGSPWAQFAIALWSLGFVLLSLDGADATELVRPGRSLSAERDTPYPLPPDPDLCAAPPNDWQIHRCPTYSGARTQQGNRCERWCTEGRRRQESGGEPSGRR